jgi:hypothetical protein
VDATVTVKLPSPASTSIDATSSGFDDMSDDSVKPLIIAFSETFKDMLAREEVKRRALRLLMAGTPPEVRHVVKGLSRGRSRGQWRRLMAYM